MLCHGSCPLGTPVTTERIVVSDVAPQQYRDPPTADIPQAKFDAEPAIIFHVMPLGIAAVDIKLPHELKYPDALMANTWAFDAKAYFQA